MSTAALILASIAIVTITLLTVAALLVNFVGSCPAWLVDTIAVLTAVQVLFLIAFFAWVVYEKLL